MGLDIGTSGCKAGVFEIDGRCLSLHHKGYGVLQSIEGEMELDVPTVWQACMECLAACAKDCGGMIEAISVSSQGEAIFPVERDGSVGYHAIVTFDGRARGQAEKLKEKLSAYSQNAFLRPIHSMFSAPKLLWLREQQPGSHAWKYMCFMDYAMYMLSGEACIDLGLAGRTLLYDLRQMRWCDAVLKECGVTAQELSTPVASGTVVGKIRQELAEALGLRKNVQIVAGSHDQQCCALGVGVIDEGVTMDTLGTTESLLCVTKTPVYNDALAQSCIPCDVFLREGYYAYLGFLNTSGQIVDWLRKGILDDRYGFDALSSFGTEPSGLLVFPHFAGSGTPWLCEKDRGMIYGLTCATDRSQLFKGILEGTAYEARVNVELMRRCGLTVSEIRITGGGARSELWLRTKADVYRTPLTVLTAKETGALGAAMLAARGMNAVADGETPWVCVERIIEPDQRNADRYDQWFGKYQRMMEAMEVYRKYEQLQ